MGKMKKIVIILLLIAPMLLNAQVAIESIRIPSKKEVLGNTMWMLFNWYTRTYAKCPQNVDDLTTFIDRMDEDSRMIYTVSYKYLKKNKKRLSFVTTVENGDSIVNMYKGRRLALGTSYVGPCESLRTSTLALFDSDGYYFEDESLTKQINEALKDIYIAYQEELKPTPDVRQTGSPYDKIIVEFTPSGKLRDLCSGSYIDLSQSEFYTEIYNCLYKTASDNNLSRIITPTYVD
jgi:hypothetical protein